jgi:hypothetical protein
MSSSASAEDRSTATLFARLLGEAGVSDTRFARQVNARARAQRGIELGLARTTVGHWRRGMRPRDPMVAELAAAEMSALVGYPIVPADLGWKGEPCELDDLALSLAATPEDTVRTLAGLSGRDMRRRDLLHDATAFVASGFAEPVLASLTGVIQRAGRTTDAPGTSGAMIRDMTETFRKLDAQFGSAEIRSQVVTFLHDRIRSATQVNPNADLCGALAELSQFAGWLAQDCARHSLAQRYYIQALSLAEHADDAMLAGRVLSGMSAQAGWLHHAKPSLALARAALHRAARDSSPTVLAMLHDKHAWALARDGDEAGCTDALTAMEKAIARSAPGDGPAWAGHYNAGDVAECQGHCLLMLGRATAAERRLVEARGLQANTRTRSRSEAEASLAISYLRRSAPDLEAALAAGHRAATLASGLTSTRVTEKLRELDRMIAGYPTVAAREWRQAVAPLLRPPPRIAAQRGG